MNKSIFHNSRRNRYAAPIGGVFIILCLVGFFTVVSFCLNTTKSLLDNSARKKEFERMLLPVVIFDPVPFENPVNIDNASLLQYSIWSTAMGEKRSQYEYDDAGMMIIPASDIDVAAQQLFGPDVRLEHRSFGDLQDSYLYEEEIRSYHVPIITVTGFATPQVEEINKMSGDTLELRMGYLPPSTILDLDENGNLGNPEPEKYMIYEMHKNRNGWYLYAIKDLPGNEQGAGDFLPPMEMPGQDISISEIVPEMVGNAGSLPGGEDSSSSDEGSSSDGEEGEGPGEGDEEGEGEGEGENEGEGEGEPPEGEDSSSEEPPPEMQG